MAQLSGPLAMIAAGMSYSMNLARLHESDAVGGVAGKAHLMADDAHGHARPDRGQKDCDDRPEEQARGAEMVGQPTAGGDRRAQRHQIERDGKVDPRRLHPEIGGDGRNGRDKDRCVQLLHQGTVRASSTMPPLVVSSAALHSSRVAATICGMVAKPSLSPSKPVRTAPCGRVVP